MLKKVEGTSVDTWIATGKDWNEFQSNDIISSWTFKRLPLFDCRFSIFGSIVFDISKEVQNDTETLWVFVKIDLPYPHISASPVVNLSMHDFDLINKAWNEFYE